MPGVSFSLGTIQPSARNRRLITLSISAYGDHPEHAARPDYDALVADGAVLDAPVHRLPT